MYQWILYILVFAFYCEVEEDMRTGLEITKLVLKLSIQLYIVVYTHIAVRRVRTVFYTVESLMMLLRVA